MASQHASVVDDSQERLYNLALSSHSVFKAWPQSLAGMVCSLLADVACFDMESFQAVTHR